MNKEEMQQKLNILLENEVITQNALNITNKTFDSLSKQLNRESLENSDMFWTHLCMAITRIERGEVVEGPPDEIKQEIYQTPHKVDIEKVISYVSEDLAVELPKEEVDFFYLHLHNVVEKNK